MQPKKHTGFSLIELIVSMTIVAVLALSVVPSVNALMNKSTVALTQAALMQDIRLVRSLSRSRRIPSYLCAINDQNECVKQSNWAKGWLGYLDNNYSHQFDEGDELLLQYTASETRTIDVLLHTANKTIMVDSTGIIRSSGHFRVCDGSISGKRPMTLIRMNVQGRLSLDQADSIECL